MTIKDVHGIEIDTKSKAYQDFLRLVEMDRLFPDIREPSGWMTLGEATEYERQRQEQGGTDATPLATTWETVPATKA